MFFKLTADYIHKHVTEIHLSELSEKGIKGLIFDLDNTIMAPRSGKLTKDIDEWLKLAKETFKIAVVTNNPDKLYLEKALNVLNCPIYGKARKPSRKIMRQAIECMNLRPEEVVIIGDRPLTDILAGKRIGSMTILVDPLLKKQEHQFIKLLRKLERSFMYIPEDSSV
jgi:uncharacterized protein